MKKVLLFSLIFSLVILVFPLGKQKTVLAWEDCGTAGGCTSTSGCDYGESCVAACNGLLCCCSPDAPSPGETPIPPWTCFPAGTKILMGNESRKNIEDVRVGDKVVSQSEGGKRSVSMVTQLDQPVRDHMCQIKFTNGESLKLTDEHPLFTQDGWKSINPKNTFKDVPDLPVTELKKGDKVVKSDGTKAEVESFACWSERIQTYNLILDNGANTYFANGFLAHNKYVGKTCPEGETWSCGSHEEAIQQNKTHCTGRIECDDLYWPATLLLPQCSWSPDPVEYTCYSNCSCCPTGTNRTCTQGDEYTYTNSWVSGSLGGESTIAAQDACKTHDDILVRILSHWETGNVVYYQKLCREQTCTCVAPCNVTAPTILSITRGMPQTTATVRWNSGSNGTSERLYFDTDKTDIDTAQPCPSGQGTGSGKCTYINLNASSPQVVTGLALNTTYYVRVQNYKNATCSSNSLVERYLSSCTLSPTSIDLFTDDDPIDLTSGVKCSPEIQKVDFSSLDPETASVSPSSDTSCLLPANPYKTSVHPKKGGNTEITSTVYFTSIPTPVCTSSVLAHIANPAAWWQVVDGDVSSGLGLRSRVPSGEYFDLKGAGGYPGIPAYKNGTNLTASTVSEKGWIVNSASAGQKSFSYDYFANLIPQDIVQTEITSSSINGGDFSAAAQGGYEWYRYTGSVDLNIDANINLGTSKVILLVENENADLNINGTIKLADGQGFFLAIVKGNINISSGISGGGGPHLEGLYFADGTISTGTTGQENDTQLRVRGSLAGGEGISIERNPGGSNSSPAEIFEYAPDQAILFPPKLSTRRISWKEVAP